MSTEPMPTAPIAWHALRVVARRIADAHDYTPSPEPPPDNAIPMPGDRERRRLYWLALSTRLAILELTHRALALDVGNQRAAAAFAEELEAGADRPGPLQDTVRELAIAVRRFADTKEHP